MEKTDGVRALLHLGHIVEKVVRVVVNEAKPDRLKIDPKDGTIVFEWERKF